MKKKLIITITAGVAALILIGAFLCIALNGASEPTYAMHLSNGRKYLNTGEYDNAIAEFQGALELDDTREEAYIYLYRAYDAAGYPSLARRTLETGFARTGSESLRLMIVRISPDSAYSGDRTEPSTASPADHDESEESGKAELDLELLRRFSSATFSDYKTLYPEVSCTVSGDEIIVRAQGLAADLHYYDTDSVRVIDRSVGQPYQEFSPNKIVLDDTALLFHNAASAKLYILQDEKEVTNIRRGDGILRFCAGGCEVMLHCNAEGDILLTEGNEIVPLGENRKTGFELRGMVTDAEARRGIGDARITVSYLGTTVNTATSDSQGWYSVMLEKGGAYQISVSKTGYEPGAFEVFINEQDEVTLMDLPLSPVAAPTEAPTEADSAYTLEGSVLDALTGAYVGNAEITVAQGGATVQSVTSDNGGKYTVDLSTSGNYTVTVSKTDYITATFDVYINPSNPVTQKDFPLSPKMEGDSAIRIVLTWGETPSDLDSHLIGTTDSGQSIHVYYEAKKAYNESGSCVAELDLDDTTSYGPETTTIYDINGTYDFIVNDFTNSGTMSNSGAQVQIYVGNSLVQTVDVCAGLGNDWLVCHIDHGTVSVINAPY